MISHKQLHYIIKGQENTIEIYKLLHRGFLRIFMRWNVDVV